MTAMECVENKPRVIWEGKTVRVSATYTPFHRMEDSRGGFALISPSPEYPANYYKENIVVEKLAGVDVFGKNQWTVVGVL